MTAPTHCETCRRDIRPFEVVDDECPICGADLREQHTDGPAETDDWAGGFAENN